MIYLKCVLAVLVAAVVASMSPWFALVYLLLKNDEK